MPANLTIAGLRNLCAAARVDTLYYAGFSTQALRFDFLGGTIWAVQNIPDTVIGQEDVPGALIGAPDQPSVKADRVYATVRKLWVEPYTGAVIKGEEQVNQRLIANGKTAPIILGKLAWDDATVKANVDEYGSAAMGLRFVSRIGPIGGWILGPIFLLVGLTMLAVSRRRNYQDEWDDEDQTHYQTV